MANILVLVPMKKNMHEELKRINFNIILTMIASTSHNCSVVIEHSGSDAGLPPHPARASHVGRIRYDMIAKHLHAHDYVFWLDADIVSVNPPKLLEYLVNLSEGTHITAPAVMLQNKNCWYDTAGFIHNEKRGKRTPPYWEGIQATKGVVELNGSVGCVYLVPSKYYTKTDSDFVVENPLFTEHYPVCSYARTQGAKLLVNLDLEVHHAWLPQYGEAWHK